VTIRLTRAAYDDLLVSVADAEATASAIRVSSTAGDSA